MGGLNAPLGVEDSRRHQSVRLTTEKHLDVRLDRTGQAFDEVHCAGQPVAVVAGETRDQAAHAGTLIEVEYAVEPPVVFSRPIRGMRSCLRSACGRSRRRAATPGRRSRTRQSRSKPSTRCRTAITTIRPQSPREARARCWGPVQPADEIQAARRPTPSGRQEFGRARQDAQKTKAPGAFVLSPAIWCSRATRSPYFPRVSAARDKPPSYRRLAA
jgi:hypothetical protein